MNTIQEVVEKYQQQVMDSFPSIFTKGDVQHLLGEMLLEMEKVPRGTQIDFDLEEFKEDLLDGIDRCIDNYDIEDEVELEMSGREIQVTFDTSSLKDEIRDHCSLFLDHSEIHKFLTPKEYV
jgi:hypothetical protein